MKRLIMAAVLLISLISIPAKVEASELYTAKATAYCLTGTTATGTQTQEGHTIASKPEYYGKLMCIWLDNGDHQVHPENFLGLYTVEDTGASSVRNGFVVDIYIADYDRAIQFGAKNIIYQIIESEG